MWIQFNDEQLGALKRLIAADEDASEQDYKTIAERIAWYEEPDANNQQYRDAVETNDELEMDDDAVTSIGDEGAFVMTWTFVSNEQAGITEDDDDG